MSASPGVVTIRPLLARVVAWAAAVVLLATSAWLAAILPGSGTGGPLRVGPLDQAATVGLGVILAGTALVPARLRVTADADGIRFRNLLGGGELGWGEVRAVRFDRTYWWATLELRDGDEVSLLALQSVDRHRAVEAVRALRSLHATHRRRHDAHRDSVGCDRGS